MVARRPLVRIGGRTTQLPAGDPLPAKLVAALPAELEADAIYYVQAGAGFDVYVTNSSAPVVAYPLNINGDPGGSMIEIIPLALDHIGQTSIEVPGGYSDHVIVLVRNGSVLAPESDYTATDELTVDLKYPVVNLHESLVVHRFSAFAVANAYSQAQVNALLKQKQDQIDALQGAINEQPRVLSTILKVDATNAVVTLQDLMVLNIPRAGVYDIFGSLRYRTNVNTNGLGLAFAADSGEITALVKIRQAVAGTAAFFEGGITALGETVVSASVQVANTPYPARVSGAFIATKPCQLTLQFRPEVAGAATVQAGSFFYAREVK